MGCDIHAYIDYDWTRDDGEVFVWGFCHPNFRRDYSLFALMAGGIRDERQKQASYPVRGLPEKMSWATEGAYSLYVNDEDWAADAEGYCSREDAERWTKPYRDGGESSSVWMNDEHSRVSHPDWHTASWLYPDEFEDCISKYHAQFEQGSGKVQPEVDAILAAMRAFEARGHVVRLVFWFDN